MTPTSPRLSTPSGTSRRTTQTARTISTAKDSARRTPGSATVSPVSRRRPSHRILPCVPPCSGLRHATAARFRLLTCFSHRRRKRSLEHNEEENSCGSRQSPDDARHLHRNGHVDGSLHHPAPWPVPDVGAVRRRRAQHRRHNPMASRGSRSPCMQRATPSPSTAERRPMPEPDADRILRELRAIAAAEQDLDDGIHDRPAPAPELDP